jgi:alkane 1-monooxygenase
MNDLKYLAAMSIPLSLIIGLYNLGYWSFLTPVYAFVMIPILEIIMPQDASNLEEGERTHKSKKRLFDWLLYINLPLNYGLLLYTLFLLSFKNVATYEMVGIIISMGIVMGSNGINVAHELGHRQKNFERVMAKILLLPSFYMHFYIEHNFGHHLHAATPEDPATARYNQSLYSFWFTSVFRQYVNAWKIQKHLLRKQAQKSLSLRNDMLWYTLIQLLYLILVYAVFGPIGAGCALAIGVLSFLLLETINYIEHYGLLRQKLPSGRYERVQEIHSWNSNHIMGRIVLYELTRHSDHHYKSSKKYQLLDCHETSPQMPFGYPTSMVLSCIPPLWFKIMNPRIPNLMNPVTKK